MVGLKEEWKPVTGYESRYEVSDRGKVRNQKTGHLLRPRNSHGYQRVCLYKGGKSTARNFYVHILVATAFLGPGTKERPEINHKNEDRSDNAAGNLEWCDRSYNMNYGNCRRKLMCRVTQLTPMGNPMATYESCAAASRATGIGQGSISNACLGRCQTAGGFKWRYEK